MNLVIPDVTTTLNKLMSIESTFDGKTKPIQDWVSEHRKKIRRNRKLFKNNSSENDIPILHIFLRDLLVRAIKAEVGERIFKKLQEIIKS